MKALPANLYWSHEDRVRVLLRQAQINSLFMGPIHFGSFWILQVPENLCKHLEAELVCRPSGAGWFVEAAAAEPHAARQPEMRG